LGQGRKGGYPGGRRSELAENFFALLRGIFGVGWPGDVWASDCLRLLGIELGINGQKIKKAYDHS
jgi:hypothetical protein